MILHDSFCLSDLETDGDGAQGAGDKYDAAVTMMTPDEAPTSAAPEEPGFLQTQFYKMKEQLITGEREQPTAGGRRRNRLSSFTLIP